MVEPAIGRLIRQLRKQNGMTQQQLADTIGVSQRQVVQWEMGHTFAPSKENMTKLAAVFGVTEGYLYAGDVSKDDVRQENEDEQPVRRSRITPRKTASADVIIPIRMSSAVENDLHRAAAREGMSVGSFIAYLLEQYDRRKRNGALQEE